MVAMANNGEPNQNGSQFFMTVGECKWLDGKHTIFGKIEGPTIFNLLNISRLETSEDNRPICEVIPQIESCEVVTNPFDDIVPRNIGAATKTMEAEQCRPKLFK